jgi:hypothetical protein
MVHFPAFASQAYVFSQGYPGISRDGLPHSEIDGSKPVCGSPSLIAAYHVLLRLLAPRHPPCALSSLTIRTLNLSLEVFGLRLSAFWSELLKTEGRRLKAARVSSSKYTLRVCGRKTTVAEYSVVKEWQTIVCLQEILRLHRPAPRERRGNTAPAVRRRGARSAPPANTVENTGLEPVTSWLQTRRSPS